MTLPWYIPTGAVVLLLGAGALAIRLHDEDIKRTALVQHSLDSTVVALDSLRAKDARLAQVTHVDTIRIEHWTPIYKTVRDTLLRNVHDTVEVVRFVQVADSTIKACQQLVSDCEARTRILVAENAACTEETNLWKKQAPDIWQRHEAAVVVTTDVLSAILAVIVVKHL